MHIWPFLDVPTTQEGKWSEPLRSHPFKIFHSPLMMWTCSTNPWTFQELWATIHTHKIIRSWGQISSQGLKKSQVLILRIVVNLGHAAGPASFRGTACEDIISRPVGSAQTLPGGLSQRHLLGSLSPGGLRAHGECAWTSHSSFGGKNQVWGVTEWHFQSCRKKGGRCCSPRILTPVRYSEPGETHSPGNTATCKTKCLPQLGHLKPFMPFLSFPTSPPLFLAYK